MLFSKNNFYFLDILSDTENVLDRSVEMHDLIAPPTPTSGQPIDITKCTEIGKIL